MLCRRVFEPQNLFRGFVPIWYIFDSRLLKTVRQGRKAKNLVKERRINSVLSGTPVSPEFQEMVDDIARYGNEQDRDWAIEFNSFNGFVETSESALKLMDGDA